MSVSFVFVEIVLRRFESSSTRGASVFKMAGVLFEDIFDVKDIDPEGKKFDRGKNKASAAVRMNNFSFTYNTFDFECQRVLHYAKPREAHAGK